MWRGVWGEVLVREGRLLQRSPYERTHIPVTGGGITDKKNPALKPGQFCAGRGTSPKESLRENPHTGNFH